ncbi:HesA/MoeB/ThiF family protein [Macrococcus epidermidis]|uniref:HesA/MoeB/ThiF family protein n=1 Tax=Macrococcus epidermidis TaxID=1902580 RepID=UPI0020B8E0CF|nr:HesA/MoeB/ThiF family protein [Macrococcus epidermidis]UTH16434.1 HesA/MoeB/ThiF family protein [Macrococcus epidermidis]
MSERFDRQIKSPGFGQKSQDKLSSSTFLIIGGGALGSTVSEMLGRSGAGHLVICDMDVVSLSNLHRQSLFDETDSTAYTLKVDALASHINRINSNVKVTTLSEEVTVNNIESIIEKYKPLLVIDGTDNFATRYIINDACHKHNMPWIYGACLNVYGTVYGIENQPCLRCILPNEPTTGQDCAISGIMPQTAHLVASIQVSEVMHYISHGHFSGKLTTIDCEKMIFKSRNIDAIHNPACPTCVNKDYPALKQSLSFVTKMCRGKYQTHVSSNLFNTINEYIIHQNEHFKLLSFREHKIHLLSNGRIIVFDVYSSEEATAVIEDLIKHVQT